MECAPAFNYARDVHTTTIIDDPSVPVSLTYNQTPQKKVLFESENLSLDLRYVVEATESCTHPPPAVDLAALDLSSKGHKGLGVQASLKLYEGQAVTFILRTPPKETVEEMKVVGANAVERRLIAPLGTGSRALDDPYLTKVLSPVFLRSSSYLHIFWQELIHSLLTVRPLKDNAPFISQLSA
jgi:hypothetical protein